MLIDELSAANLDKSLLIEELSCMDVSISKLRRKDLVAIFLEKINGKDHLQRKIIKKYPRVFALHPSSLEELLGITKTERIRWTAESKLPVVYYEPFRKWGKILEYPMYNYYEAIKILNSNRKETWREKHKEKVKKNRVSAARVAVKVRKENQSLSKFFYENEWKKMLQQWYKEDPITGSSLQLAFWTMWVNRFAKEMQIKEKYAIKKGAEYRAKKEYFYQLKADANMALMKSPLCKIQFYRPQEPDKVSNLQFCEGHYDSWLLQREYEYVSKWDFFRNNSKQIKKCPNCTFQIQNDYYSLFFLSINCGDIRFSFHTPYPLGKDTFPDQQILEKVSHHEQEGIFRFGRGLFEDEKVIFTEKNILKYFNEAFDKYNNSVETGLLTRP